MNKPPKNLPTKVSIAGQVVRVRKGKLDAYGQYEHDDRTIWISDAIREKKVEWETLRHEMIEASLLISGVGWLERYQQEAVVRCIEEIFFPAWEAIRP